MSNVVSIDQLKMEKQYQEYAKCGSERYNLTYSEYSTFIKKKRDIARELTIGYMRLLSK
jgi:hypothetical protein